MSLISAGSISLDSTFKRTFLWHNAAWLYKVEIICWCTWKHGNHFFFFTAIWLPIVWTYCVRLSPFQVESNVIFNPTWYVGSTFFAMSTVCSDSLSIWSLIIIFFYLFLMVMSVCVQLKIKADTHGKNLHGPATHIETNKTVSCKGAQVWDFPSLGFSWFFTQKSLHVGRLFRVHLGPRNSLHVCSLLSLISMRIYLSLVKKNFLCGAFETI